jgi:hypothetical protein
MPNGWEHLAAAELQKIDRKSDEAVLDGLGLLRRGAGLGPGELAESRLMLHVYRAPHWVARQRPSCWGCNTPKQPALY